MTALTKYARLESPGLWRPAPREQRREVVVSFGDATLVLTDPRSGRVLSHWSLPAVIRRNPGHLPAVFVPDGDDTESLEIEEEVMVAALEELRAALVAQRGRSGRLRFGIAGLILAGVILLGNFWLPGALVNQTTAALPLAKRAVIGQAILDDLVRDGMAICTVPRGREALARLVAQVLGRDAGAVVVADTSALLPEGTPPRPVLLPGRIVLIDRRVVDGFDTPDTLAGYLLASGQIAAHSDPLPDLLRAVGTGAVLRLLATGDLPEPALRGYGAVLLRRGSPMPPDDALLAAFERAGVPSRPFAWALDPSGETTLGLIEADPFRDDPPRPVLGDGDWINLQSICDG